MNNSLLDLLYGCFNQYVFQEAKDRIKDLEYFYSTNPNTSNNKLVVGLINAIKTYDLDAIGLPLFQSIISQTGHTPKECDKIMDDIIKYKKFSQEQMKPMIKQIQNISAQLLLNRAKYKFEDDPSGMINWIKGLDVRFDGDSYNQTTTSFDKVDINTIIAQEASNGVIPSRYDWINKTMPGGGYDRSQIVMFCSAPGTGKSLWAMSEAVFMAAKGYRVLYTALGDLNMHDFIVRMGAIAFGISFKESRENLAKVYENLKNMVGDRLDISILPAGVLSADEYVDFVKSKDPKYDALFIDYDGNFKESNGGDESNMYKAFGILYNKLTELTLDNYLVFVLSQPKIVYWEEEILEMNAIGESSKKQQVADIIITRGRVQGNANNLGIFKIVKARRSKVNVRDWSVRLDSGRFKSVPKEVYRQLKERGDDQVFSEKEIDLMINQIQSTINKNQAMYNNLRMRPANGPFNRK